MIKVSVIIPVHNSEKYLRECMDSIIRQTLQDIEVICVDSSSDNTLEILNQYAVNDTRIRIIKDDNSSYGHKINVGIDLAQGEYIGILESDDYVDLAMYEKMFSLAHQYKVDFIRATNEGFATIRGKRIFSSSQVRKKEDLNHVIDLFQEPEKRTLIENMPCASLYNLDFIRKNKIYLHESPGASFQDNGFSFLLALTAQKVYFVEDKFYKYRQDNMSSSIHCKEKISCIIDEFAWVKEQMQMRSMNDEKSKAEFLRRKIAAYFWTFERIIPENRDVFTKLVYSELKSDLIHNMLSNSQNEQINIILRKVESNRYFAQREQYKENLKRIVNLMIGNNKLILFGIGIYGKRIIELQDLLNEKSIISICDNKITNKKYNGISIISPQEAVSERKSIFLLAGEKYEEEMRKQLESLGIHKERIVTCGNIPTGLQLMRDVLEISDAG